MVQFETLLTWIYYVAVLGTPGNNYDDEVRNMLIVLYRLACKIDKLSCYSLCEDFW